MDSCASTAEGSAFGSAWLTHRTACRGSPDFSELAKCLNAKGVFCFYPEAYDVDFALLVLVPTMCANFNTESIQNFSYRNHVQLWYTL
eukprot:jgi/Botrbrau1/14841/Bobra.0278s0011.1